MNKIVHVHEQYQTGYSYELQEKAGQGFAVDFSPSLTPKQMLQFGVFGGDYFNEVPNEFPADWFTGVRLSRSGANKNLNYFKVNASQSLAVWQRRGWVYFEDPKGWFLWYCRYYIGRRIPEEDRRQITRWKNMRRHISQLQNSCKTGDNKCQPRRRQALLHWAYDSRGM